MSLEVMLLVLLLSGHIIGDFLLQSTKVAAEKHKWSRLLWHVFLVTVATYATCGDWLSWQLPLLVFFSHLLLDWVKARITPLLKTKEIHLFLLDQVAHACLLYLIALYLIGFAGFSCYWLDLLGAAYLRSVVVAAGFILVVWGGAVFIALFVKPFQRELPGDEPIVLSGLTNGGRVIGQLERALIFFIIFINQLGVVAFIMGVKAAFRWGMLKDPEHVKEAEYIIIGTLASFLYAIIVSAGTLQLMHMF